MSCWAMRNGTGGARATRVQLISSPGEDDGRLRQAVAALCLIGALRPAPTLMRSSAAYLVCQPTQRRQNGRSPGWPAFTWHLTGPRYRSGGRDAAADLIAEHLAV